MLRMYFDVLYRGDMIESLISHYILCWFIDRQGVRKFQFGGFACIGLRFIRVEFTSNEELAVYTFTGMRAVK